MTKNMAVAFESLNANVHNLFFYYFFFLVQNLLISFNLQIHSGLAHF